MGYPSILLLALCAACGGTAVIDGGDGGAGGAGGGTTTGMSITVGHTTTTTTSGGGCSFLMEQLEAAVYAARRCESLKPVVQCSGTAVVADACGCSVLANEHNVTEIEQALEAYKDLEAAGCGLDCETCPTLPLGGCIAHPGGDLCAE